MPSRFLRFVHTLVLFLLPLCVAAIWSVAAQVSGRDLPWLALVIALATLLMRGQLGFYSAPVRALLHACACAAGIVYAQVLIVAVVVAGPFGYGLLQSLQRMGVEMTWGLIVARCGTHEIAIYVVALLLAAAIGRLDARRPLRPRSAP